MILSSGPCIQACTAHLITNHVDLSLLRKSLKSYHELLLKLRPLLFGSKHIQNEIEIANLQICLALIDNLTQ